VAAVRLVRRPRSAPLRAVAGTGGPARLLDAIAALDARYGGRETEVPPEEWQRYTEERSTLKVELERALAARARGPYV
jgi:hypothetical protein